MVPSFTSSEALAVPAVAFTDKLRPNTQQNNSSAHCTIVKPPTTPVELLENIKCAVATNVFIDDDIFTNDEKLWQIFGGEDFFKPHGNVKQDSFRGVLVSHFPNSIDNPHPDPSTKLVYWLTIDITKKTLPPLNGNYKYMITIKLSPALGLHLNFADVERLFGHDWKKVPPPRFISPHQIIKSPTAPHGNDDIIYIIEAPSPIQANAEMAFDPAANLQSIEITLNE